MSDTIRSPGRIPCVRVDQWLDEWRHVRFDRRLRRRRPDPYFFVLALPASHLLALSGIQRRTTEDGHSRAEDLGIQRIHEAQRSREIREFVKRGYPWSTLSVMQRKQATFSTLQKPGWLPTAIVVNILTAEDERWKEDVRVQDLVHVREEAGSYWLELPPSFEGPDWIPRGRHPIEVIDGQHRLWAFGSDSGIPDTFQLPVVAFVGLDISWQAYLFWTINIKPKRINASLAFDLYPLLRTEDWLEHVNLTVYREARAQELTEALWSHPDSPWFRRINMLGEKGRGGVSQAAWVRSLLATLLRSYEGRGVRIGGLFGGRIGKDDPVLPWSRAQQAAFLMFAWQRMANEVEMYEGSWAQSLRQEVETDESDSILGAGSNLLNTDQGVRGFLYVLNDLTFVAADDLALTDWPTSAGAAAVDEPAVNEAMSELAMLPVAAFVTDLADTLATFDWRTSSAPGLDDDSRASKAAYRGSGGYRELRRQLTLHLETAGVGRVRDAAKEVAERLRLTR